MKAWKHFCTVSHHRWLVMKGCFRVGLYKQGLIHDLSKFSVTEFCVGCKYFQGNRSPNNAEREDKGYSAAWLHHKGRNRHHYEYWIDYGLEIRGMTGMKMPVKYVVEMFMDRIAACKTYQKGTYTDRCALDYYEHGKLYDMIHAESRALLEDMLQRLASDGEECTFDYIRREILKNK